MQLSPAKLNAAVGIVHSLFAGQWLNSAHLILNAHSASHLLLLQQQISDAQEDLDGSISGSADRQDAEMEKQSSLSVSL